MISLVSLLHLAFLLHSHATTWFPCSEKRFCTRCTYSQCMPRAHLHDLTLSQHVWISRRGMCMLLGRLVMHVQRSVKSVRRKAKCTHYVERVWECERVFEPHRTQRYGHFSRRPHALFASLGAAALSRTHRSQRKLHGVEAAFTLCLLHFRARLIALSFFLAPITTFVILTSWQWDR